MSIKRFIYWLVLNACLAWLLYLGIAQHVDGARHVALFALWVAAIAGLFALVPEVAAKVAEGGRSAPKPLGWIVELAFVGALVWNGYYVLGALHLLAACIVSSARDGKVPA